MINKYFILIFIFLSSGFLVAQWQQVNISSSPDIFNMSFPSNQTGYVCGYGNRFHRTTNGGTSWVDLSFAGTAQNLNAVWFVNERTGFLASTNDTIYKSSNSGESWYHRYFLGFQASNLQFIDSLNGYAFGINIFSVTTNGGANWNNTSAQTNGSFYFLNNMTGWTTYYPGAGNSELLKTTNGGLNWIVQHSTVNFRIMYDVFFINQNIGWVSGYRHYIAKTTNGGQNWEVQNELESAQGLYSIYFINSNTGWTAGDHFGSNATSCYYTTNGGTNWLKEFGVIHSGRITKIRFSSSYTGWIGGQYGKIFKTINTGGLTGISNEVNKPVTYELFQNYPNPFNPVTNIKYQIPVNGFVSLKIYDIIGREIKTLVNEIKNSGSYNITFDGTEFTSGIYFYRIQSGDFMQVKKMILIK